ncbi:DUF2125 domain-containing protein [Shimia sp. R11_0]|uniref:DUF2125 domain-containing protein n=1 Tax=Shimia sp. R11_0 TaxID=2821096 RepID=UPI001ADC6FEA|nr:DUF2125 domain-containing protein [Shimia sp. R11_0]MBO9478826.1 DUF2125 domain-containing protein [Shimia sp. R11_0]
MKLLAYLIGLAALVWSGIWMAGYWGVTTALPAWFEARQNEGWVAEYDDLTVSGFPSRLDSTFTNLTLADPDTGVSWDAPFFQLFALTYRPHHVIAVWPDQQTLATPAEKLTLATEDMRASLVLDPGTNLTLARTNLAVQDLTVASSLGWKLSAAAINLAMHRQEGTESTYRLAFQADEVTPPAGFDLRDEIELPRSFSSFKADLVAEFDRPWDRNAIEEARPQPVALDLKLAEIVWGDLQLHAAGAVTLDTRGIPTGDLTIRAVNWRDILEVARQSEKLPISVVDTVEQGLSLLAQLSGNAQELDIPLTFSGGATRLGPLPIGPAPRIVLR